MKRVIQLSSFLWLLLYLSSCEESSTGCLDSFSNNFDFYALNECDSCCTYPTFTLNFSLVHDTVSYSLGSKFPLVNNDSFSINTFELLLSDFSFESASEQYSIVDSFLVGTSPVKDDYTFIRNTVNISPGSTRFEDELNRISCIAGFDTSEFVQFKPFSRISSTSSLDQALDSFYNSVNDFYEYFHIVLAVNQDTMDLRFQQTSPTLLSFDVVRTVEQSQNWSTAMKFNLQTLLDGISANDNEDDIKSKIESNFTNSISLE